MSDDRRLQEAVLAELGWEPSVRDAHIDVAAKAGVITLTGHVESYAEKHGAELAASRVKGVKAVAEGIEVQLPFARRRGDVDIAQAALDRIGWDVTVPDNAVTVKVENGWVTLAGQVDWHFQREAAEQDVCRLSGVVGISNQVTVAPRLDVSCISDDITHALHRSWFFDDNTISVSAEGGRIRLTGTVHSPHDRKLAASTAWAAPGATCVENDITVD